jgi:glycosyltransferase involved in cell wall biosynthesis
MKIAFDAKRMLNNATGLGNHSRILVNALMRDYRDNDYLFFSPKAKEEYIRQLHGDYKLILPATQFAKALHPWWRSYGITEQLLADMVDIYHGTSNEIPLNIHRSGIKSVVTIHDLIFLKHKEQYPWVDRQIYTYKTQYAVKHANKIIAVSEETKRDLMEFYKVPESKIAVIYQSIDTRFSTIATDATKLELKAKYDLPEKFILNVGSFYPRKNQLNLIRAFELIKDKTDHHLVLVGSAGSIAAQIKKAIIEAQLQSRVHIINNVSNDDLPTIYRDAALFVFPSLFEGFGMPVLEALTSGLPVVATQGGAVAEAAGPGSLLIDPHDISGIADKILLLLNDKILQKKMREEGVKHAKTMTDTVFARRTMDVYREVIG